MLVGYFVRMCVGDLDGICVGLTGGGITIRNVNILDTYTLRVPLTTVYI
jgi:hypothetical protein